MRSLPLYVSTRTTARLVSALLVLTAAVSWIHAGYDLGERGVLDGVRAGAQLGARERLAHTEAGRLLAAAQLGCAAVVATLFLPWIYHARVNARALGVRRLRFRREWACLAFLVPGLNLYRPAQVLSEIWRASDPSTDDPLAWQRKPTRPLVWVWWLPLVAWPLLEALAQVLLENASTIPRLQLAHGLSLAGNVCAAVSASAASLVVARISADQEAKWRSYGDSALPATTLEPGLPA